MNKRKLKTIIWDIVLEQEARNAIGLTKKLNDLEAYIHCGVTYGHRFTLIRYTGSGYIFRCTNCNLDYYNNEDTLTKKEKELVILVFSKQNKKTRKVRK